MQPQILNADRLDARPARNEAFWSRGPAQRPLIGLAVNATFPAVRFARLETGQGRMTPEMVQPEAFLEDWDQSFAHSENRGEDLYLVASPHSAVPWMEAIVGCEVYVSPESGSIWAEHPDPSWGQLERVGFDPNNPWLLKLIECVRVLREHAALRYPISAPILRGVSDMAAALLGPQRLTLECYDHPSELQELLARCTEVWQGVGHVLVEAFGRFHGGQCAGRRRVWTRGTCMLYQDDAAAVLSPALFREFVLPHEHEILKPYARTMIHTHSGTLRIMIEGLLSLQSLAAIEVQFDPSGPSLPALLGTLKRIQDHKALVISGELGDLTLEGIQLLRRELSPRGLCLLPKVRAEAEADALLAALVADGEAGPPEFAGPWPARSANSS
jgi:hypothetical protein